MASIVGANRQGIARLLQRLWLPRNTALSKVFTLALIVCAVVSGIATYMALTEVPPFGQDTRTVIWLLNLDLIILILLVSVIARRAIALWTGHRRGIAGSRLHMKLAFIFSLMAAVPAIIMTVFSAFFLHFGVQTWFSDRIRTAVNESEAVAEAYLAEHQQVIKADTLAMANDLDRQASFLLANQEALDRLMKTQLFMRNFSEAVVVDSQGRILAEAGMTFALAFEPLPTPVLQDADTGNVVLMSADSDDRVRALVKLNNFFDSYLFVGRMVDPVVLRHLNDSRQAVAAYEQLESTYGGMQIKITMIFVVVALILLLSAMWAGLFFAREMVMPISSLINAADRVRAGDLAARVPAFGRQDEFDTLGRTFNRMTSQIEEQQNELISANRQLDQRRLFTEAVLAGVSSGIIGVDHAGNVTIANASAAHILEIDPETVKGRNVDSIIPELKDFLADAYLKAPKTAQYEIPYVCKDESKRMLLVRITCEVVGDEVKGAVLTFDDITELQAAQRKAAWADVARRIAHEIKNPLTPIQLSAERLKRKYLKQITDDPETFSQCTDTIIHHVGDIGRMVNEFSAFARMPLPVIKREEIVRHLSDMIALQQQARPDISFLIIPPSREGAALTIDFDSQQMRQAFTNIIQNAIDSIDSRISRDGGAAGKIKTIVSLRPGEREVAISVIDNGLGFPKDIETAQLVEPYVTRREKGTGLGLAIVKKIMDDHKGRLVLGATEWLKASPEWEDMGGACVSLVLPADQAEIFMAA